MPDLLDRPLVAVRIGDERGRPVVRVTWLREEFQAQVPSWLPADDDLVVVASGVVELVLGAALIPTPDRYRALVGSAWRARRASRVESTVP